MLCFFINIKCSPSLGWGLNARSLSIQERVCLNRVILYHFKGILTELYILMT